MDGLPLSANVLCARDLTNSLKAAPEELSARQQRTLRDNTLLNPIKSRHLCPLNSSDCRFVVAHILE